MLIIRDMMPPDEGVVMPMVGAFYDSPAVEHPVEETVLLRAFHAAVDSGEPLLRGLLLLEDGRPVGYSYLALTYSAEVAGRVIQVEELYLSPDCRGKGYGKAVFRWLMEQYPESLRIRLEVTPSNQGAIRLYEQLGFRFLEYGQMVLDSEESED